MGLSNIPDIDPFEDLNISFWTPYKVFKGGICSTLAKDLVPQTSGLRNRGEKITTIECLLTNLYFKRVVAVLLGGGGINSFKNKNYTPRWYTRTNINFAVEALTDAELIITLRGVRDTLHNNLLATTLFSSAKLQHLFDSDIESPQFEQKELIVLHDKQRNRINYKDTPYLRERRSSIKTINEFQNQSTDRITNINSVKYLYYNHPLLSYPLYTTPNGSISHNTPVNIDYCADARILNNNYFCVYNENPKQGGRLYTSQGVQNITKEERKTLTIDEQETIELDHNAMHPRLLYGLAGIQLNDDPYLMVAEALGDAEELRPVVKLAFNIGINAKANNFAQGFNSALEKNIHSINANKRAKAIQMKRVLKKYELTPKKILEQIKITHKPIAEYIASGYGIILQRKDSDIMATTLADLMEQGVQGRGVHDSVRCKKTDEQAVRDAMHNAYEKHTGFHTRLNKED